ncbi:hypothetical protein LINPERPRIM_LOCUS8262 [Linum perenne]
MSFQHPEVPGDPTATTTSLLEKATASIQRFGPISHVHQHLCAYFFFFIPFFLIN